MRLFVLLTISVIFCGCASKDISTATTVASAHVEKPLTASDDASAKENKEPQDPISLSAKTELYPNTPVHISVQTLPEKNLTILTGGSCNSQYFEFDGLENLTIRPAHSITTLLGCEDKARRDSDNAFAYIAEQTARFKVESGHLILEDATQHVMVRAKILDDKK